MMAHKRATHAWAEAKGTALVESAIAIGTITLVTSAGLVALYVSFARVWIERSAYEAAVCLAGTAKSHVCERRLRASVGNALPIGTVAKVTLFRTNRTAVVKMRFMIGKRSLIHEEKILALPLGQTADRRRRP
jgi:hypothetical protein